MIKTANRFTQITKHDGIVGHVNFYSNHLVVLNLVKNSNLLRRAQSIPCKQFIKPL